MSIQASDLHKYLNNQFQGSVNGITINVHLIDYNTKHVVLRSIYSPGSAGIKVPVKDFLVDFKHVDKTK